MSSHTNRVAALFKGQTEFNIWSPSKRWLFAYLLMLPAVLTTAMVIIYPIFSAIDISLQRVRIGQVGRERTAWPLENYQRLVTSGEFWQAVWVTIQLVTVVTALAFVLGLAMALLVNQRFRGRTFSHHIAWAAAGDRCGPGDHCTLGLS